MGISQSREAAQTLAIIGLRLCGGENRNRWEEEGRTRFYEVGAEHDDGAITGSIWAFSRFADDGSKLYKRAGSFRIDANGHLARGPRSWRAALADRDAELRDLRERSRYTEPRWRDWNAGSEVLAGLRREAAGS